MWDAALPVCIPCAPVQLTCDGTRVGSSEKKLSPKEEDASADAGGATDGSGAQGYRSLCVRLLAVALHHAALLPDS